MNQLSKTRHSLEEALALAESLEIHVRAPHEAQIAAAENVIAKIKEALQHLKEESRGLEDEQSRLHQQLRAAEEKWRAAQESAADWHREAISHTCSRCGRRPCDCVPYSY